LNVDVGDFLEVLQNPTQLIKHEDNPTRVLSQGFKSNWMRVIQYDWVNLATQNTTRTKPVWLKKKIKTM